MDKKGDSVEVKDFGQCYGRCGKFLAECQSIEGVRFITPAIKHIKNRHAGFDKPAPAGRKPGASGVFNGFRRLCPSGYPPELRNVSCLLAGLIIEMNRIEVHLWICYVAKTEPEGIRH
jgi:hypothetical protein